MEWRLLDEATARAQWNTALATFADCNAYQSYEWGEYRREASGVTPYRWAAYDDTGKITALLQGALVRKAIGRGPGDRMESHEGLLDKALQPRKVLPVPRPVPKAKQELSHDDH